MRHNTYSSILMVVALTISIACLWATGNLSGMDRELKLSSLNNIAHVVNGQTTHWADELVVRTTNNMGGDVAYFGIGSNGELQAVAWASASTHEGLARTVTNSRHMDATFIRHLAADYATSSTWWLLVLCGLATAYFFSLAYRSTEVK